MAYEVCGHLHFHRLVGKAKHADDLAHTVRAVVEKEDGIVICCTVRGK